MELRKYFPLPRSKKSTLQVASTSNQADTPLLHSSERSLRRQASSVLPTHVAKRPRVETPSKVECEKLEENALQWLSRSVSLSTDLSLLIAFLSGNLLTLTGISRLSIQIARHSHLPTLNTPHSQSALYHTWPRPGDGLLS